MDDKTDAHYALQHISYIRYLLVNKVSVEKTFEKTLAVYGSGPPKDLIQLYANEVQDKKPDIDDFIEWRKENGYEKDGVKEHLAEFLEYFQLKLREEEEAAIWKEARAAESARVDKKPKKINKKKAKRIQINAQAAREKALRAVNRTAGDPPAAAALPEKTTPKKAVNAPNTRQAKHTKQAAQKAALEQDAQYLMEMAEKRAKKSEEKRINRAAKMAAKKRADEAAEKRAKAEAEKREKAAAERKARQERAKTENKAETKTKAKPKTKAKAKPVVVERREYTDEEKLDKMTSGEILDIIRTELSRLESFENYLARCKGSLNSAHMKKYLLRANLKIITQNMENVRKCMMRSSSEVRVSYENLLVSMEEKAEILKRKISIIKD